VLTKRTPAQIEATVHDGIKAVLAERNGGAITLSAADKLNEKLGLSSLDLAFLVAELEADLEIDPFAKLVAITSVRTVGDLVRAYQQALFPELQPEQKDPGLAAAAKRGQARRAHRERRR